MVVDQDVAADVDEGVRLDWEHRLAQVKRRLQRRLYLHPHLRPLHQLPDKVNELDFSWSLRPRQSTLFGTSHN